MTDHDSIVKNNTTERYLLRELTEAEHEAFEEHYFECPICAERVHCGSELMQYGREVALEDARGECHETPQVPVHPPTNNWNPALRAGMLAILMIGVGVALYHKSSPNIPVHQVASATSPALPAGLKHRLINLDGARSKSPAAIVLGSDEAPELTFAITSPEISPKPASYQAVLLLPSGRRLTREITAQDADDQIDWPIEREGLTSGGYSVSFRPIDKSGTELKADMKTLSFTLQLNSN